MKKGIILLAACISLALFSCRETEMNTDGNMEDSDSPVETRDNN